MVANVQGEYKYDINKLPLDKYTAYNITSPSKCNSQADIG